jgi:predicted permease
VPDPHQLYQAQSFSPGRDHGDIFSAPTFEHMRDALSARGAAELFAATSVAGMQLQADGEGAGARGTVQLVSGEYFAALRQQAQFGRLFEASDNRAVGAHPVAVVSDGFWRRRFGAAPDAVGRSLAINGTSFAVVGVTRPHFFGTTLSLRAPDVWIPYMMQSIVRYSQNVSENNGADTRNPWPPQPAISWLNVFARVPANEAGRVEAAATTVSQRDNEAVLPTDATADDRAAIRQQRVALADASTGLSVLRGAVAHPLYVLLAMVAVLLVISCGNVAGLLLSRAAGRAREMAIRQSIGAGRLRLVRQMLAESLLLAVAGGLVGITFAVWARDALLGLMVNVGSWSTLDLNTALDGRVLGFSLAVSALTGLGCGLLPAFRGTRVPVAEALKHEGRGSVTEGGRTGLLIGKTLVAAQMAFCLLLLVVAALFTRSFRALTRTDIGFDREHVLTARVDVRGAGYSAEERQALYRRLVESLQAIPGVAAASCSANGPLGGSQRISSLSVEGHDPSGANERLRTNEETVTDRYFETMGLRLLDGRGFRPEDRAPGARSTLVNATMAHRFFPGQSAVGKRWNYGGPIGKDANVIIGVVEDARYVDLKIAPPNMAYVLADANQDDVLSDIEVRAAGAPGALTQTVRETLARAEPRLPIVEVVPLEDRLARGVIQDRMVARLTVMFGALALLLASLGLYGTISYGISRRVAELGLRMALGADRGMVLWLVLREALTLVVVGAVIGLPLALAATRSVRALLFGVGAADPWSFVLGAVLLLAVAALAAYLPAHRASRIEPMVALGR